LITIKDPSAEISGLTMGDRVHNVVGVLTVTDHINKLEATATYNPKVENGGGMLKSFKNKLFKKRSSEQ
jgi:hypothetical protein